MDLAFTDRVGGVSAAPFAELNLAVEGDDDPGSRQRNLELLLADFAPGDRVADLLQVHGREVVTVGERPAAERPRADALVTDSPGVVLVVRAADCVPVLLADPVAGVVGAAHAGRPGLVAGVVPAVVSRMRELGARRIEAWVGPHVCGGCYEVPEQMRDEVAAVVPESRATTTWGTPALDVGAGVVAQLRGEDVVAHDVSRCTRESPDLFSYRRDGRAAGRLAGVVRRRA
ncbi:laccase [Nocardioides sp. Leaf285]|nr:laccase [Nocardioides sp. Leaf285]